MTMKNLHKGMVDMLAEFERESGIVLTSATMELVGRKGNEVSRLRIHGLKDGEPYSDSYVF